MFGLPSIRIGRVFGIPLEVNPTWLIIFALVVVSLATGYFPAEQGVLVNFVSAAVTALLFFASVVAHEMSHSLVARAGGTKIERVTLFIFGGVAQMEEEPASPGREFVMAVAGPGMSLALAMLFFGALVLSEALSAPSVLTAPLLYLSFINLYVAVFNLLPGFPLDGGRVLRAALWAVTGDLLKATRWASRAGQVIGYLMVAIAVFGVFRGLLDLVWLGLIGWFISSLAETAYRQQVVKSQLHRVPVAALMSPAPEMAPGDISLEQLAHEYFLSRGHSRYPVLLNGAVVGLISLSRAKAVPREQWVDTMVADAADRELDRLLIEADRPADEAVLRLAGDDPGALLAVREGRMVGILTRSDLIRQLRSSERPS